MLHKLLFVLTALLLIGSPVVAQGCADVNGDGHTNISDMVYMMNEHLGGVPIPTGKGDIDYRQGYNAGDIRFLIDYIFSGGSTPGCPPFPSYSLVNTDDSLILPSYVVPAGSGQFVLPIYVINHAKVSDMVMPMQVNGLGSTVFFDSLQIESSLYSSGFARKSVSGSTGVIAFSVIGHTNDIASGINLLALAFFHYTSSPGGTVSMDTVTIRPHTFLNYVYGPSFAVGIPRVVVAAASTFPEMIVEPDTLIFETLVGYPNPDPQQFSIQSSGEPFNWTLTPPPWVSVDATSGVSGQNVSVTPNTAGLSVGVYYGDIVIFSTGALGTPQKVVVKLTLKQQFLSLDANCDGVFNLADIVAEINYIFRGGNLCNPCTGEWPKGKQ
ncbi:MAG: hypothetical protein NT028_08040 [candidate division Zixibacteria bacterium]|nr:hypothetical protein [candidate division Zixibacteria bacterium]